MTQIKNMFENLLDKLGRIEHLLKLNKEVFTVDEMSLYSGMSKSYLYKLTSGRKIPFYQPTGKLIYFKKSEVDAWLFKNRVKTEDEIREDAHRIMLNPKSKRA